MVFSFSIIVLFGFYCLAASVTNGKFILRETTTFSDGGSSTSLTRGKRPNERINISFPGIEIILIYKSVRANMLIYSNRYKMVRTGKYCIEL